MYTLYYLSVVFIGTKVMHVQIKIISLAARKTVVSPGFLGLSPLRFCDCLHWDSWIAAPSCQRLASPSCSSWCYPPIPRPGPAQALALSGNREHSITNIAHIKQLNTTYCMTANPLI